ncbi:site-specific integrase [uncultured Gordonia sp.]|uniref:site-specific integrase n=1 Tax=uncultured Gordonia sp. TaxID=198437 RepID=UPI00258C8385|nr:site-specific integrase [uncultured Gordonia sp.]
MDTPEPPAAAHLAPVGSDDRWPAQWAQVPAQWREPTYRLDRGPAAEVFRRNNYYLPRGGGAAEHSFTPRGAPRLGQEIAWWVHTCWAERRRQIEPSQLTWAIEAISAIADGRARSGRPLRSITDVPAADITRAALVAFEHRNGRLPTAGSRRNIENLITNLHVMLTARCTDTPWWALDVWDLRIDDRIPRREHEPRHDRVVALDHIEPGWLREGLRFWFRMALTHEFLRWSSVVARARTVGADFGAFAAARGLSDPLISDDPTAVRATFTDFLDTIRLIDGAPRSTSAIGNIQYHVQSFYTFIYDHAADAATHTGNPRWADADICHTMLWSPINIARTRRRDRDLTWHATTDIERMLSYLDVLAADPREHVTITHADGTISDIAGMGDPQAARIWLLQALTGRRASEILMLDVDPIEPINTAEPPSRTTRDEPRTQTASDDGPRTFVAKLRYQQTKVDGVIGSIFVEQEVVDVITEQQAWIREHHPDLAPRYLFLNLRNHRNGQVPRTYSSYGTILKKLDQLHSLTDNAGNPLRFTQTHRLRHTRATELLNDGVPFHVVQRYLGHRSPEMTARYAATLAATAEAEFLKHKKIGAYGTGLSISPADAYDLTQLDTHTDRVLPNGVCLLPPLKTCDKGNACLTCGHFATDRSHLGELERQRLVTIDLVDVRRATYRARTGRELTDDNIWITERHREIRSLDAIIEALNDGDQPTDTPTASPTSGPDPSTVVGAGTADRAPQLPNRTKGVHHAALDAARSHTRPATAEPTEPTRGSDPTAGDEGQGR